jgi:hypothetical protein
MTIAVLWDAAQDGPVQAKERFRDAKLPPTLGRWTTQRNSPEDSHLHTCHRETLKSHGNEPSQGIDWPAVRLEPSSAHLFINKGPPMGAIVSQMNPVLTITYAEWIS